MKDMLVSTLWLVQLLYTFCKFSQLTVNKANHSDPSLESDNWFRTETMPKTKTRKTQQWQRLAGGQSVHAWGLISAQGCLGKFEAPVDRGTALKSVFPYKPNSSKPTHSMLNAWWGPLPRGPLEAEHPLQERLCHL